MLLLYNLRILAADQKRFCFFEQLLSTQLSLLWIVFVFMATFEQLFEKLRENFWTILNNLWKALKMPTPPLPTPPPNDYHNHHLYFITEPHS